MHARIAGVVTDQDGSSYGIGSAAYAVDASANLLWERRIRHDAPAERVTSPFVISPDRRLYAAMNDGRVLALDALTGETIWEAPAGETTAKGASRVVAGYGNLLLVSFDGTAGYSLLDRRNGQRVGGSATVEHGAGVAASLFPLALLGDQGVVLASVRSDLKRTQLHWVGIDGNQQWWSDADRFRDPNLRVTLEGQLLNLEPRSGEPGPGRWELAVFGCSKPTRTAPIPSALKNPVPALSLIGAEGSIYIGMVDRSDPKGPTFELSQFSAQLERVASLVLPGYDLKASGIIDDDQTLYLVGRRTEQARVTGVLVAVSTSSPGLAETVAAAARFDKRQSGWISQSDAPVPVDAAGTKTGFATRD